MPGLGGVMRLVMEVFHYFILRAIACDVQYLYNQIAWKLSIR